MSWVNKLPEQARLLQLRSELVLYMFADERAEPTPGGRESFHDLDVGEAGDGVGVGVNRAVLKFDRDKIIADLVRRYTRVTT